MVFAFIAGLVMALVVVRTGSLWTSILIHFINNSVSFALEMVQRYAGDAFANQVNYIVMGVMLALGLIAVIWLTAKDRHFFRSGTPDPLLRFSSKLGALFSNPGGVAMLVFAVVSSVGYLVGY
jgi:CAAX amino terminal protease family.